MGGKRYKNDFGHNKKDLKGEKVNRNFDRAVTINIIILIFSIFFEAKGIFNLGILTLLIFSVYKIAKRKDFSKEKLLIFYFMGIFIGIISNIPNGTVGDFLSNERSLIYILIFLMLNIEKEKFDKIKDYIIIAGVIPSFYSFISYYTPKFWGINTLYHDYRAIGNRMQSFVNLIRWGSLLQVLTSFNIIKLVENHKSYKAILVILLEVLFVFVLLLNGTRAGLVGLIISLSFVFISLSLIYRKKVYKYLLLIILSLSLFIGYVFIKNPVLKERVMSITSTTHLSNRIRLDFYKIGWDVIKERPIGYGSDRVAFVFEEFMKKQNESYKEKYYNGSISTGSGTPFENNYINLAVENGVTYVIYINLIFLLIIVKLFRKMSGLKNKEKIKILIIIGTLLGQKAFTFFFPGTDSYVDFIFVFLMFYAFALVKNKEKVTYEVD